MAAASTNNSASRPIVPCGVVRWGCVVQCGAAGLPEAAVATVEPERLRGGPEIDRTARDWGPDVRHRGSAVAVNSAVLAHPARNATDGQQMKP